MFVTSSVADTAFFHIGIDIFNVALLISRKFTSLPSPRLGVHRVFVLAVLVFSALAFSLDPLPQFPHTSTIHYNFLTDTTKKDSLLLPMQIDSMKVRSDTSIKPNLESPRFTREPSHVDDSLNAIEDSLDAFTDSVGLADSLKWEVYLDSTYRISQFVHRRVDQPAVEAFPHRIHSLYLGTRSPAYKRELELDSIGQSVTIRERINGLDVKIPVTMTLEDYINMRYEEEKRNNWRGFATEYKFKERKDDLSGLLGSLTNIEIPVPANPLLSIFGRNVIKLNVSGAVDIRGAYRNQKSDQVTVSALDQSRSEPDFNQEVRINVNGTVGDKLNILADWNTQRTFEYENQLKIKYTGYEDEIVQSVEAGNVSLQTPSLVGGGQALFGIKAKLQTGPLTLTTLLSQKKGQTKELAVSGGAQQSSLEIFPHQYSKSYYFVDTLYEAFYDILHRSQIPNISQNPQIQQKQIIKIDLWVSQSGYRIDPSQRQANAYIDLPPRLASASYPSDVESTLSKRTGDFETGRFIKIDPAQYKVNQYAGYIVLNTNVTDDQALAVSYTVVGNDLIGGTADDEVFGSTSEADTTVDGKLILKLVKPRYLQPSHRRAWKMLLKNVYPIGGRDLKKEGFELHVLRRTNGPEQDAILGEYLLRVLGLDRFDQNNSEAPDNVFDFIPGLTVNVERAEIIFP
ncbi:MAG TPA: cell surface protein SprA, partial [Bacteroidota bacterium]|nr:cell surface protein SprA [Bacteroidota bacterium]